MQSSEFWTGFEKRAMSVEREDAAIHGTAAATVGGAAIHQSIPLLHGRTTLYHGTSTANHKKIMEEGLKATGKGVSTILNHPEASKLVYLHPNKHMASTYANQAEEIHKHLKPGVPVKDAVKKVKATEATRDLGTGGKIIKAKLPLWKHEFASKMVKNPEVGIASQQAPWATRAIEHVYDHPTFKRNIPAEHIVGSKKYVGHSLNELGQYIKAKPKHFAAGAGLALAGAAGIGFGAKRLHDAFKKERKGG